MNFRKAEAADVPEVKNVVYTVLMEYGLKPDPEVTDRDLNDFEKFYFNNGGYFEVCEVDGKIVGTWGILKISQLCCELRKMYLLSSLRGRGIGKKMLERSKEKAKELGFSRIELETASVLKEAISMYQKFGFEPISGKHLASRCDQAFELHIS